MRKIKAETKLEGRVETGALQINDDWAGLFIRGDDCAILRNILLDFHYRCGGIDNINDLALKLLSEIADAHGEKKMIDF